jgi:hypothetical protein
MRRRLALAALLAVLVPPALAQSLAARPRGVYARINMDAPADMVRRLGAAYGTDRRLAIREVLGRPAAQMPPVLYALANALAEDHAEEAIFWYHVGRLRAVYDALRCRDKTAQVGMLALRKQLGQKLIEAQAYRRDRLVRIAKKAVEWDAANDRSYDQRWIALYGKVAAESDGSDSEIFVPEAEWPAILKHVHEAHLEAVEKYAAEK